MEVLGIDIGGSGMKGAVVNVETGKMLSERYRVSTPQPANPQNMAEALEGIVQHFGWNGRIGCGFPAAILHGVAKTAANIDDSWIGTNVEKLFAKTTNCLVKVINDVDAAGLAEVHFGVGKNVMGSIIMITLGTGIGTALFIDGMLYPNTELGHIIMNGMDAEHYTSNEVRKTQNLDWDEWARRINQYLAYMESLFWPDLIIIGGGGSKYHAHFFHKLKTQAEIKPAHLLNEAGIIGSAFYTKVAQGV